MKEKKKELLFHFRETGCGDDGADIFVVVETDEDPKEVREALKVAVAAIKETAKQAEEDLDPDNLVELACDEAFGTRKWSVVPAHEVDI